MENSPKITTSSIKFLSYSEDLRLSYKILKVALILSSLRAASSKFRKPSWSESDSNVQVHLEDETLWNEFHLVTNEMIITKLGRCLFPNLKVSISGLNPGFLYAVGIDFVMVDYGKYKFKGAKKGWFNITSNQSAIDLTPKILKDIQLFPIREIYEYADSPRRGDYWNKCILSFNKIKLTNKFQSSLQLHEPSEMMNYPMGTEEEYEGAFAAYSSSSSSSSSSYLGSTGASSNVSFNSFSSSSPPPIIQNADGLFSLHSFHRYIPRINIVPVYTASKPSFSTENRDAVKTFVFAQTSFIAVTHYQNNSVNVLKKNYNPHAKGFKDINLTSSSSSQSSLPFQWSSPRSKHAQEDWNSEAGIPGKMYKISHSESEYFSSEESEV